jgi:polyferredoxin
MLSAGFVLGFCVLLVIPFTPLYFMPWPFFAFNFVFFLIMITISLIKILAFVSPARKKTSLQTPKTSGLVVQPMVTLSQ